MIEKLASFFPLEGFTCLNVVHPSMKIQTSLLQRESHGGMCAQVRQLGDHIFAHETIQHRRYCLA